MGPETEACTPWRAPGNGRWPGGGSGARAGKLYCCRPDAESVCARVHCVSLCPLAPCIAVRACVRACVSRPHRVTSTTTTRVSHRPWSERVESKYLPIKSILPTVGSLFTRVWVSRECRPRRAKRDGTDHSDLQPGGKGGCGIACEAIVAVSLRLVYGPTRRRVSKESRSRSRLRLRPPSTSYRPLLRLRSFCELPAYTP